MNSSIKYCIMPLLLLLFAGGSMRADDGDFNPTNPPEPNPTYKVTVTASPSGMANASGTGRYKKGQRIRINASSADSDYEFKYWKKDGAQTAYANSFYYTVEEKDVEFEAVYGLKEFDPTNPADPNMDYKYRVYLSAEPSEACSFNFDNGARCLPGDWVTVRAYASQGFVFQGWYDADDNDKKLSDAIGFNYEMPNRDAHLVARFYFNPSSPDDPSQSSSRPQDNVDNGLLGDVNDDGLVDVTDATQILNKFLESGDYDSKYDINNDKVIDVTDATKVLNIYLGN